MNSFILLKPDVSKFYTDKDLFFYTLEAYKKRKEADSQTVFVGQNIGLLSFYNGSFMSYKNVQNYTYTFLNKSCKIKTIYPK